MTQRRRLSREERRDQLLDAAVRLAAGGDVAAVSVEQLAAEAGVSEGLLYHYFPTKESLFVAAVERAADSLMAALDAARGRTLVESMTAGLTAYLDLIESDPVGWRAVLSARGGELAAIADRVAGHSRALTLRWLGIRSPSPAMIAALDGWALYERGVCLAWLEQPRLRREVVLDLLATSFLSSLDAAARYDRQARRILDRLAAG